MHQSINTKELIGADIKAILLMAVIIGKPSKYLKGMAGIHTAAAIAYLLISAYIVWTVFAKNQAQLHDPVGVFALLIVFGPLFAFAYWQYKKHDYGSSSFLNGIKGENDIAVLLKDALSDEFTIFCDVIIDPRHGNIDYVVVGPTGIFTLEVKSHRGQINFDGQRLTRNNLPLEKDFLHQAMGQAISLHGFLQQKLGADIFVKPVIVFSSYAQMHFGMTPVKNVLVIQKHWLTKLLGEGRYYFPVDRNSIEQQLMTLVAHDKN